MTQERHAKQARLRGALHAAGCVPILLRPEEGTDALARVRGLVLPGGGDLDPRRYGHEPIAEVREPDPERDDFELALAAEAVARGVPVLGICRGLQVLAVALGGALRQQVGGHEGDGCRHGVRLDPASRLARVLGAATVETNSSHHQAPDELPALLARVGVASDGVIEAAEGPGFTVGVGWHPETEIAEHGARLLGAFVEALK